MEKLIEYYNEYYQKKNLKEYYDYIKDMVLPEKFDSLIFLKDFCKWLVDNDKIELEAGPLYGCQLIMHNRQPYTLYETLLMLLAISDTPIDDLILYLK